MKSAQRIRWPVILMAVVLPLTTVSLLRAADPGSAKPAEKAAAEDGQDKPQPVDRYAVPDGDVDELVKFINTLQSFRPRSFQTYMEHRQKAPQALTAASKKILALKPAEDSQAYRLATFVMLQQRVGKIAEASEEERAKIIKAVKDRVAGKKVEDLENQDVGLVMGLARTLERSGQTKLAGEVNRDFGKQFAASSNPQIAGLGRMLQGVARRIDLVGNEMEISGKLLDGSDFDWASYRGKVVLVDFWATWCGPCVAELPNVQQNYDQYHDQGFDVVGISLDRSRDDLEKFLAKKKLPWATLYAGDGVKNPNAVYYGIMGIPTVILVGRDGKVVSLSARGPELGRLLKELIGPPSKPAAPADPAPPATG